MTVDRFVQAMRRLVCVEIALKEIGLEFQGMAGEGDQALVQYEAWFTA